VYTEGTYEILLSCFMLAIIFFGMTKLSFDSTYVWRMISLRETGVCQIYKKFTKFFSLLQKKSFFFFMVFDLLTHSEKNYFSFTRWKKYQQLHLKFFTSKKLLNKLLTCHFLDGLVETDENYFDLFFFGFETTFVLCDNIVTPGFLVE
jgi:hypothetical protein